MLYFFPDREALVLERKGKATFGMEEERRMANDGQVL